MTLKAYRSPEIPFPRVNGSPRVADFGSQGTAGSPILLPPPKQTGLKSSYKPSQPHTKLSHQTTGSKPNKTSGPLYDSRRGVSYTLTSRSNSQRHPSGICQSSATNWMCRLHMLEPSNPHLIRSPTAPCHRKLCPPGVASRKRHTLEV